jgi:speckle-type POZ protein
LIKSHEQQLQSDNKNAENKHNKCLELPGLSDEILQELLRYIYTERVDNLDTIASTILPVGKNYHMPGLKLLCERTLVETITPECVASLLLLADQFGCDSLKRAT